MVNLSTSLAATSAISALYHAPLHVQSLAFAPAARTRTRTRTAPVSLSGSLNRQMAFASALTSTSLSSSTIDASASEILSESENVAARKGATTGEVAKADYHSFNASPNGKSGIMSIKLREEDKKEIVDVNLDMNIDVSLDVKKPVGDGVVAEEVAKSSASGMFGGIANQAKIGGAAAKGAGGQNTNKKATQGEDFIGKAVVFPNGGKGTVIAQRPPMAFVLCDFGEYDPTSADDSKEGSISVLGTRTTVPVSEQMLGTIVDCYGNPIDGTTTSTSTSTETRSVPEDLVERAIFAPIPKVSDISLINNPLLTGTAMVEALAPIGKGQNMLIIGQEKKNIGQRDLVIGAIKTQVQNQNKVKCVYALTSQDKAEREEVLQQLKDASVLDDIVVVVARDRDDISADDTSMDIDEHALAAIDSAEAIGVAATACSIAEALALAKGEDTFVVVDDIDQHKAFWDWTTRILVDVYGVDAVVKDDAEGGASSEMRGFYSSLIQRAAQFSPKNGGGSVTLTLLTNLKGKFGNSNADGGGEVEENANAVFTKEDFDECSEKVKQRIAIIADKGIPLTAETLRKIQIPLPVTSESEKMRLLALQHADDLISMSDGQVWLDETLYAEGQRPAMDPQRSITRVGVGADTKSRADAPAMRGLAGGLRFDFAQANSLDGAGANSGADKQILKKQTYLLAMHQDFGEERTLSENCIMLLAASLGVLDDTVKAGGTAGTEQGRETVKNLLDHVQKQAPLAMSDIDSSLDLSDANRSELEDVIKSHFS